MLAMRLPWLWSTCRQRVGATAESPQLTHGEGVSGRNPGEGKLLDTGGFQAGEPYERCMSIR